MCIFGNLFENHGAAKHSCVSAHNDFGFIVIFKWVYKHAIEVYVSCDRGIDMVVNSEFNGAGVLGRLVLTTIQTVTCLFPVREKMLLPLQFVGLLW